LANVNRYVGGRGEYTTVLIAVPSAVTVELGDLMFLDNADNLRNNGSSSQTNVGYPFEHLRISGSSLALNKAAAKTRFLGVAMDDKDGVSGGVTQNITVATSGKFNMDLKPAKSVRLNHQFGASGTTAASDLYNQKVMVVSATSYVLGIFAEAKIHARDADVFIHTIFNRPG